MGRSARDSDTVDITVSAYQNRVMRTTLTLDDDVYQAVVEFSQSSGEGLGKVASKLIRRGLQPPAAPKKSKTRRFPVFDVKPGTPMMSVSRIQRFIDEEGLF
jgi:hypothetical protein